MRARKNAPRPNRTAAVVEPKRNAVAEWAVTILMLLFGTTTVAQAFVIPTGSMEDTLLIGDHLLVDKLTYAPAGSVSKFFLPYQEPRHGDIIAFRYPPDPSQTLVKRLIGAPGDHLRISRGVVYRNGIQLNEPYVYHKLAFEAAMDNFPGSCCRSTKTSRDEDAQRKMLDQNVKDGELIVPPQLYFAMGDNRDNSYDSRFWGLVPRDNLVGKPVFIWWSYRAPTEDLLGESAGSILNHWVDLGEHFFTRTRWSRTFRVVRGFPDSRLPAEPLPINPGLTNP